VEVLKVKIQDLERVERLARVDLEQVSKRVCNEMFTEFNWVYFSKFRIRPINEFLFLYATA